MPSHPNPYLSRVQPLASGSLRLLHPSGIEGGAEIRALLERVHREKVLLWRGMNRRIIPETAQIERFEEGTLLLRTRNFQPGISHQVFLNFFLADRPYFFAAPLVYEGGNGLIRAEMPAVIHRAERRDRVRHAPGQGTPTRVVLGISGGSRNVAEVADWSGEGLGLLLPRPAAPDLGEELEVRFLDGARAGEKVYGEVCSRVSIAGQSGWIRIGLDSSTTRRGAPVMVERRDAILPRTAMGRARQRWRVLSGVMGVAADRAVGTLWQRPRSLPGIDILDYESRDGEKIRAIVDSWGPTARAPAVLIPPAWGRTKETLMPLAACIVAAFQRAREPVAVIRFDGIRKRGESYNDPNCRAPGKDHHRFTFFQGVRDIQATLDFLENSPRFRPSTTILVSFSAASIEARRAVATDRRIGGWISVVGAPDLQSMMRVISGGVDYAVGLERGVSFGLQEILGVEVDMDYAGLDSFEHRLTYLEDARRDMAGIRVPITWIRGRFDAWMDADRALDVLSRGDTSQRRFIELPTGHMLKTSREALEAFQLITREVSRMALGSEIEPTLPNLRDLELRHRAERNRFPNEPGDIRAFWKDYLLGRDAGLGIELMTSITPYEELMETQVKALQLRPGNRVADFGSGTGAFALHFGKHLPLPGRIQVYQLDYVREGFNRARQRLAKGPEIPGLEVLFVECDLDINGGRLAVPLASESVDAVLASLFLSYVSDPYTALQEIFRVLRPSGKLVLSSLRPDADMSKLYMEGIEELRAGRAREILGRECEPYIDDAARAYLNQAARLLDLEEKGVFRFWDAPDLKRLARKAGFRSVSTQRSLGNPPQAVVLSADRP